MTILPCGLMNIQKNMYIFDTKFCAEKNRYENVNRKNSGKCL